MLHFFEVMQIMTLMTIFDGHLEECEWSVPSWSWLHTGQAAAIARSAVCQSCAGLWPLSCITLSYKLGLIYLSKIMFLPLMTFLKVS